MRKEAKRQYDRYIFGPFILTWSWRTGKSSFAHIHFKEFWAPSSQKRIRCEATGRTLLRGTFKILTCINDNYNSIDLGKGPTAIFLNSKDREIQPSPLKFLQGFLMLKVALPGSYQRSRKGSAGRFLLICVILMYQCYRLPRRSQSYPSKA